MATGLTGQENIFKSLQMAFLGPLYYVLFILSLLVALAMTWRFLTEVHGYRQFLHRLEHQGISA